MLSKPRLFTCKGKWWLLAIAILNVQISLAATSNIIIALEEPSASNVSTGIANLRGWAVGLAPISKIELYIDGQYSTDVPSGSKRVDVGKAFPNYPNANNSGFSMAFAYSSLSPGSHTALVRAYDVNGLTEETSSTFNVTQVANRFLSDPGLVRLTDAAVSVDRQGVIISNLKVESRAYDVRLHWRVASQQFEIESVVLDESSGGGITRRATSSALTPIPSNNPSNPKTPLIIALEEPSSQFTSNGIANLRGWAVGQSAIKKIELFIDGQYSSDVPFGGARFDVGNIYPEYPNSSKSGFSMAFSYSDLSEGNHTALVRVHDAKGRTQDSNTTFNVTRFKNSFIPKLSSVSLAGASVKVENEQIIISKLKAEGLLYTVYLQWRTATQQFEIQKIVAPVAVTPRPNPNPNPNPGTNVTKESAARFLTQATFGPTIEDINHLVSLGSYKKWLKEQFLTPVSKSQLNATEALWLKSCPKNLTTNVLYNSRPATGDLSLEAYRVNAWWESVINSDAQLRHRVALALSETLVVSGATLIRHSFGLADYYDLLTQHAFGNYRTLLEEVTLHPIMGLYLNMLQNRKSIRPDENFARELLQLFSIGLFELNLDGSIKLANGKPIPSYDQDTIKEFAKVFTGWNFSNATTWVFPRDRGNTTTLMTPWEAFHSDSEKRLLRGTILPAGQTTAQDLSNTLDNVFNHPNVGPFISKQLIQRLVTSNPSPAYVQRIAQVFNSNNSGVRGDLKSVVRAILLDQEARTEHLTIPHYGKLREPILRLSHLRRAFNVLPVTFEKTCGRGPYEFYNKMSVGYTGRSFSQEILQSPSVFNFFLPDYIPAGPAKDNNMTAPEFQIVTADTVISLSNEITFEIFRTDRSNLFVTLRLDRETLLSADPNKLLDHLDLLLLSGSMSTPMRGILLAHLANSTYPSGNPGLVAKAKDMILLIVSSPDYLIQK